MQNFVVRTLKSPALAVAGIVSALIAWQILQSPTIALTLCCGVVIGSVYYAAIYLYSRNDSMMGGLPRANYGYSFGFYILLCGNVITCWGFFSTSKGVVYLGSVLLLVGTGLMIGANSVLFNHIIRRGLKSQQ